MSGIIQTMMMMMQVVTNDFLYSICLSRKILIFNRTAQYDANLHHYASIKEDIMPSSK